ncbi:hypothetical protein [Limnospira fusiformis]
MVRQQGIIPRDLYSLIMTHPTGGYGRRSHSLAKIIRLGLK